MLKEYFHKEHLYNRINPDESIAFGAAIQAAVCSGQANETHQKLLESVKEKIPVEEVTI